WLPGARDGWDWAVERLERGTPSAAATGRQLGELLAELHAALATPTPGIPEPRGAAAPGAPRRWYGVAKATPPDAVAAADGADAAVLRGAEASLRTALDRLPLKRAIRVQPVHGDLHVGQVLEWAGGLALIDFDGNPALGEDGNAIRQPIERDVAQML